MSNKQLEPFINYMEMIFPDKETHDTVMNYMAWCVQNPGQKLDHALIVQGPQGVGKSLLGQFVVTAMGRRYVHVGTETELECKFNGWQRGKLMMIVEEIMHIELDKFKPIIHNDMYQLHEMYRDPCVARSTMNLLLFTSADVFKVKSRSFKVANTVAEVPKKMDAHYFKALFAWWEADGYRAVTSYLFNYKTKEM